MPTCPLSGFIWPEYCDYTYKPLHVALASVLLQLMQITRGIDSSCVHEQHASPSVKFCLFFFIAAFALLRMGPTQLRRERSGPLLNA